MQPLALLMSQQIIILLKFTPQWWIWSSDIPWWCSFGQWLDNHLFIYSTMIINADPSVLGNAHQRGAWNVKIYVLGLWGRNRHKSFLYNTKWESNKTCQCWGASCPCPKQWTKKGRGVLWSLATLQHCPFCSRSLSTNWRIMEC
jgi:hypothetical protein